MARVLGLRLLKLDAVVVLAPAGVAATASPPRPRGGAVAAGATPAGATRHRLDEAVRSLEEGAQLLSEARRLR